MRWLRQQTCTSHSSGSGEVQNQGSSRSDVWCGILPGLLVAVFWLCAHMAQKKRKGSLLFKTLIPPWGLHSHDQTASPRPTSHYYHIQFSSVAQSCPTLCDPMNCSMPGLPVHHKLPEFTQTHVHRVSDAIQPSHPLPSPSPPAPNPSQHQSLFQWVNSSLEVAKVLEFQL